MDKPAGKSSAESKEVDWISIGASGDLAGSFREEASRKSGTGLSVKEIGLVSGIDVDTGEVAGAAVFCALGVTEIIGVTGTVRAGCVWAGSIIELLYPFFTVLRKISIFNHDLRLKSVT
jgi:hypothetical protein